MKMTGACRRRYSALVAILILSPCLGRAQLGDNAVWVSGTVMQGSGAFVDAAAFCGSLGSANCGGSVDFCTVLHMALTNLTMLSPAGGIVDARGVVPAPSPSGGGGFQGCGSDPFSGISPTNSVPITVLLPASTINMVVPWTLPNNVRLIGEGQYTILEDNNALGFTGSNLINMGSSSCPSSPPTCSGISIEHLTIQMASHEFGGIVNQYAAQSSYVKDVDLKNLHGTGILIKAANSGPYTNISFTSDSSQMSCSGVDCPMCVDVEAQIKGLHGVTCVGNSVTGV